MRLQKIIIILSFVIYVGIKASQAVEPFDLNNVKTFLEQYKENEKKFEKITREEPEKILGVTKNTKEAEIKKAFNKLALKWHGDKWVGKPERPIAEEIFKLISEAKQKMIQALTSKSSAASSYSQPTAYASASEHEQASQPMAQNVEELLNKALESLMKILSSKQLLSEERFLNIYNETQRIFYYALHGEKKRAQKYNQGQAVGLDVTRIRLEHLLEEKDNLKNPISKDDAQIIYDLITQATTASGHEGKQQGEALPVQTKKLLSQALMSLTNIILHEKPITNEQAREISYKILRMSSESKGLGKISGNEYHGIDKKEMLKSSSAHLKSMLDPLTIRVPIQEKDAQEIAAMLEKIEKA